jgi:hypothetical protein
LCVSFDVTRVVTDTRNAGAMFRLARCLGVGFYNCRSLLKALDQVGSYELCSHCRELHPHQDRVNSPAVPARSQAVELAGEAFDVFAQLDDSIRNHYPIATAFDPCRLFNQALRVCRLSAPSIWSISKGFECTKKAGIRARLRASHRPASWTEKRFDGDIRVETSARAGLPANGACWHNGLY